MLTVFVYSLFHKKKKVDQLIDEKTKMSPLHFIAENLPISSQIMCYRSENNSSSIKYDCIDEFDYFINQIIFEDSIQLSFFNNYSDELKKYIGIFKIHLNSIDSLKQTPLIKAILNLNLYFATFLISECCADIENVDFFGNTALDYLLLVSDISLG